MTAGSFCRSLDKALDLEVEGHEFYMQCAEKTKNRHGQDFFRYLAGEELVHYDKVAEIYRREFKRECCSYEEKMEKMRKASGIFEKHVRGGNLDEKSDALDALNIAIKTEDKSIELYSLLAEEAEKPELARFFSELASEEEKHKSLLENEIEFVTETGAFADFRVVTS